MKQAVRIVFGLALGLAGALQLYRVAAGCAQDGDLPRGTLFAVGAAVLLGAAWLERVVLRRKPPARGVGQEGGRCVGNAASGRVVVEGWLKELDKLKKDAAKTSSPKWTPDNPKPQTFDFDNGKCPYKRDSSKPLGTRENPVVAGVPESSDRLVFSPERGCWILTDGLGNGWIR